MKASINSKGVLKIEAESELEGYALKKWLADYQLPFGESPAVIQIIPDVPVTGYGDIGSGQI